MTRRVGMWGANGANPDLDGLMGLVGNGCYSFIWDGHGAYQANAVRTRYPKAEILMRHHRPNWNQTDPVQWAAEVASRMGSIRDITRRVVAANEMNLEPDSDFSVARFADASRWYGVVARELLRLDPGLWVHFPAPGAGHSEDQPDLGYIGLLLPETLQAIQLCRSVNCHTYWDVAEGPLHEMGEHGGGLRYRKVARLLQGAGMIRPIWIDEAGPWAEPWRVEQTAAHSQAVAADGVDVTYFLWADPTGANTFNSWYGRVPNDKVEWLRQQWAALPTEEVKPMQIPDLAAACILATSGQLLFTADCAWHLAQDEEKAIDVAPAAGVGDLLLVAPWRSYVEFTSDDPANRGYNCGLVDTETVYNLRIFGETEPWDEGSWDTWLEVGLCHAIRPIPLAERTIVEARTLVGLMGYSGKTIPAGPAGRHLHLIAWVNQAGDLTFRHWRRVNPELLKRKWGL